MTLRTSAPRSDALSLTVVNRVYGVEPERMIAVITYRRGLPWLRGHRSRPDRDAFSEPIFVRVLRAFGKGRMRDD